MAWPSGRMMAMESARTSATATTALRTARCVVFAYHEVGYACLSELLDMDAPIAALFTHPDNPAEEIWWRPCRELARRHGIAVFEAASFDAAWQMRVAAMQPAILYSFFYRNLLPAALLNIAPMGSF